MRAVHHILFGAILTGCATLSGRSAAAPDCNRPAAQAVSYLRLPGRPFQALPTPDGCWVFVSLPAGPSGSAGVAVLRRGAGAVEVQRVVPLATAPTGMVLTHDAQLLIAAAGSRIAFLDVGRLVAGQDGAILGYIGDSLPLGNIYVNVTSDDDWLFASEENAKSIAVIDLERARASRFRDSSIVGRIPVGRAPIALTLAPDDAYLYTTSEIFDADGWPQSCTPEAARRPGAPVMAPVPQGAVHIVDVERATRDPRHAVMRSLPAGCSPVRLVLSPDGTRAYVTARGSDELLVFDRRLMHTAPLQSLVASVPVGSSPVGVATIDNGDRLVVTNSHRFAGGAEDRQSLSVIDAAKVEEGRRAVVGSIQAGAFPRELRTTADGRTLLLTNFGSQTLEIIDLARLPLEAAPARAGIPDRLSDSEFWRLFAELSEPGGYFRSDNFLSNETTFQWVIPKLAQEGRVARGAYLGVGPEQNFTYMTALRPPIAFIFDIRRQNAIEHLMYKALIEMSSTRAALVSNLFARPRPPRLDDRAPPESLFAAFAEAKPDSALYRRNLASIMDRLVKEHGFALDSADRHSLEYVYGAFFAAGPEMTYTFSPAGRGFGRGFMPTYATLMTESDSAGTHRSWLASEENYRVIRDLELRNLVVPVVGDFAGPKAIHAVGDWLRAHDGTVSAFYLSNVEQYLFRQGDDGSKFFQNVSSLPVDSSSVFLRALFRYGFMAPQPNPGRRSETLMCPIAEQLAAFRAGKLTTYDDVATGCR